MLALVRLALAYWLLAHTGGAAWHETKRVRTWGCFVYLPDLHFTAGIISGLDAVRRAAILRASTCCSSPSLLALTLPQDADSPRSPYCYSPTGFVRRAWELAAARDIIVTSEAGWYVEIFLCIFAFYLETLQKFMSASGRSV